MFRFYLAYIVLLPLLELLHGFIKMVKIWDIYVVDFVEVVKLVQVYKWCYCSSINFTFNDDTFAIFNNFINFQSDVLLLV